MTPITWLHIAAGLVALLAGAGAIAAPKGRRLHGRVGMAFVAAMLVLGVTAAALEVLQGEPTSALGGVFTCYFVATAWVAARRRDGGAGAFEIAACGVALAAAAGLTWAGFAAKTSPTPAGVGPVFALASVCLLAGLLDLSVILRRTLSRAQRISRHLWRMCFGFFIATGSFFLGQQDVMPEAVRGSPALFVLAFAPLAVMLFWLVRVRIGKRFRGAPAAGIA